MIRSNRKRLLEEQIEIHDVPLENGQNWVVLKGTPKLRIGKYEHETAKADIYVAVQPFCDEWVCEIRMGDGRLVPDATLDFEGTRVHFEVDLGNEKPDILFHKIERYTLFAGTGEKVVFALRDGKYKAGIIGTRLMDYCRERRLGNFVTATLLDNFVQFPTGDVLVSPKDGRISFRELIGSREAAPAV